MLTLIGQYDHSPSTGKVPQWSKDVRHITLAVTLMTSICLGVSVPISHGDENNLRGKKAITLQNAILKTIVTVTVAAEATGVLQEVPVDIGTLIRPGDSIAKIRDDDVRVQLSRAQLELKLAAQKSQSDIDVLVTTKSEAVAKNEYLRALDANLTVPNTYPPNEIDRLRLVYDRSRLEVRRAEEQRVQLSVQTQLAENRVDEIKTTLRKHTIDASTEGVVVSVEHHAGEWVEAGTPIATIVNLKQLRVEGFVSATDTTGIAVGAPAKVEVQFSEEKRRFDGRVIFVSPDVNSVSNLVRIFIDVENPEGQLRPGLRTTVSVHGDGS